MQKVQTNELLHKLGDAQNYGQASALGLSGGNVGSNRFVLMLSSTKQSVLKQRMPGPPLVTIATMILSSIHYIKALESFGGKAQ